MPAFISHMLLGDAIYDGLPSSAQQLISEYPASYAWGLIGPDVLLFRLFSSNGAVKNLGKRIHSGVPAALFEAASAYLLHLPKDLQKPLKVYLFGLIGHYRFDSLAHPYVFAMQQRDTGKSFDRRGEGAHHRVEADIDTSLFHQKTGGQIHSLPFQQNFSIPHRELEQIALFYQQMGRQLYAMELRTEDIALSFRDALRLEAFFTESTGFLAKTVTAVADLFWRGSPFSAHVVHREVAYDALNLTRQPWSDESGTVRFDSVMTIFEAAAKRAVQDSIALEQCHQQGELFKPGYTMGFDQGNPQKQAEGCSENV